MQHYLKFAGIFFSTLALASLALGLLSALVSGSALVIVVFGSLTVLAALAIGAVVLFLHGLRCAKGETGLLQRTVAVLASPVLTLIALPAILPLAAFGHYLGTLATQPARPDAAVGPPITVRPAVP